MRFVLKYKGEGQPDLEKLFNILREHKIKVLDQTYLPQILFIELNTAQLDALEPVVQHTWTIYQEKLYKLPSTRKSIER